MPENFLIAPFKEGLDKELEPWLLQEEAFVDMKNAFIKRGVLQKRSGYVQLATGGEGGSVACDSRIVGSQDVIIGESLGNTDGAGAASGTIGTPAVHVGTFAVTVAGTPAETFTDDGDGALTGSITGTGTITYGTGAWTITGSNATEAITANYTSAEDLGTTTGAGARTDTLSNTPVRDGIVIKVAGAVPETINDWGNGELYAAQTTAESGGNTDGNGDASFTLTNNPVVAGSVELDVDAGALTFTDDGNGVLVSSDNTTASGTVNYTSGAVTISDSKASSAISVDYYEKRGTINYLTGAIAFTGSNATKAVTCVYSYYADLPAMGIYNYINANDTRILCVADTRNFNKFNSTTNRFDYITHSSATTYTGVDSDYWHFTNYSVLDTASSQNDRVLVFTNGVDKPQYFDGTNTHDLDSHDDYSQPPAAYGGDLQACKLVFYYGDRLCCLNVKQDSVFYPQRLLYSGTTGSGTSLDFDNTRAGVIDAPTDDEIMGGEFISGDLVVFFRNGVWAIKVTTDRLFPFRWERIGTKGVSNCDARFSVSSYYGEVTAAGKLGIISTDGNTTARIDNKLPFFTRDDIDPDKFKYCYSEISERSRQRWMTYASKEDSETSPDSILINGLEDNSWSIYTIPMHCLGNYHEVAFDKVWDDFIDPWDTYGELWDSYSKFAESLTMVGGDYNGYILQMDTEDNDDKATITGISKASPAVVTVESYRFSSDDVVKIYDVSGMSEINGLESRITEVNSTSFQLNDIDSTNFTAYADSGRAEKAIAFDVRTKPLNPWIKEDRKATLHWVDFRVDSSAESTCNVQFFTEERIQSYRPVDHNIPNEHYEEESHGSTDASGNLSFYLENPPILVDSVEIDIGDGTEILKDDAYGNLTGTVSGVGAVDYRTGYVNITGATASSAVLVSYSKDNTIITVNFRDNSNRPVKWFRVYVNSTAFSHQIRLFQEQVDERLRIHAIRLAMSPAGTLESI